MPFANRLPTWQARQAMNRNELAATLGKVDHEYRGRNQRLGQKKRRTWRRYKEMENRLYAPRV
jgi:hypothetical protein